MFDLISIVVTGRNDADSLRDLLTRLKRLAVTHETLYFDLGSDDGSVQAALEGADRVYRVEDVSGSRSAGRWAGAKLAEFDWLLFLDADMQIQDEFIDFLNNRTYMRPVQGVKAFVGSYHLVENGVRSSRNLLPNVAGSRRARFGGALLVQTEALMAADNWNPALWGPYGHADLAFRLAHAGCGVEALPIPMVTKPGSDHRLSRLRAGLLPLNRSWLGVGQLVVSQIRHHAFLSFLLRHPWPLLLWAALLAFILNGWPRAWQAFALMLLYLVVRRGPKEALGLLTEPLRAPFGMLAYRSRTPKIERVE